MKKMRSYIAVGMSIAMIAGGLPTGSVSAATLKLKNTGSKKIMPVGSTLTLKTNVGSKKLKYSSSKKSVVSINSQGKIEALKKGSAVISVKYGSVTKKVKVTVRNPKGYSISKKSSLLSKDSKVKITAKKGYNVYYAKSLTAKLKKSKVIKSGQSGTFTISTNKTFKVYAIKKSQKVTKNILNKKKISSASYGEYTYKIISNNDDTSTDSSSGSSVSDTSSGSSVSDTSSPTPSPVTTSAADMQGNVTPKPTNTPLSTPSSSNVSDDSMKGYVTPAPVSYDDEDNNTEDIAYDSQNEIIIPAKASSKVTYTDESGVEYWSLSKKNKLTIEEPGVYVVHTEGSDGTASTYGDTQIDGWIDVDLNQNATGTVQIILDGVNLINTTKASDTDTEEAEATTAPDEDLGVINIANPKQITKAIVTLKEGSKNSLENTWNGYESGEDSYYGNGIYGKKIPVTINGKGELNISNTLGNGIKVTAADSGNDYYQGIENYYLKIVDASVNIGTENSPVGKAGITSKLQLYAKDANISAYAVSDAVKTGIDDTEYATYTAEDAEANIGNIRIEGGKINVDSTDGDGIYAYYTLYLAPDTLSAVTHNAAKSTDSGSYKAVKAGTTIEIAGGTIIADSADTKLSGTSQGQNNGWQSSGSSYSDDAIHCNGSIKITGGDITCSAADDGIHADSGISIDAGTINVTTSYEGIEAADITVNGGDINVISDDDGFNAAGGSDSNSQETPGGGWAKPGGGTSGTSSTDAYQLIFNGGNVYVNAGGDGIDSNGNLYINGGVVKVEATSGGNGPIDYGDNNCICEVNAGATLMAVGVYDGMQSVTPTGGTQAFVSYSGTSINSGSTISLKDSQNNALCNMVVKNSFSKAFVVMSAPGMTSGSSYILNCGSSDISLTGTTSGTNSSGGWGGNMPGNNF